MAETLKRVRADHCPGNSLEDCVADIPGQQVYEEELSKAHLS